MSNNAIDPFFRATIEATEEAVVNAMLAAPATFEGVDGLRVFGLPGQRVVEVLKKYGRMPSN
jgi:D-aminopeptidase